MWPFGGGVLNKASIGFSYGFVVCVSSDSDGVRYTSLDFPMRNQGHLVVSSSGMWYCDIVCVCVIDSRLRAVDPLGYLRG